jgi:AcrR family transcriptional regulator
MPDYRLQQLLHAATLTFVQRGFRLTQMADVAAALGLGKGTLYGYVESKEALFDACVRFADTPALKPPWPTLPLPTPEQGSTVRFIQARLAEETRDLLLAKVLGRPSERASESSEWAEVLGDLFDRMWINQRALKLVDRCAVDFPELAAVWFKQARYGQVALLKEYIERGVARGDMKPVADSALAARMVLETISLWAIHMPWDPSPQPFCREDVKSEVLGVLTRAYAARVPQ